MGCPPDPIEIDFHKGNEQLDRLELKFEQLKAEVDKTKIVIRQLLTMSMLNDRMREELSSLLTITTPDTLNTYDRRQLYNSSMDTSSVFSSQYSAISTNENIVKQKENELCLLRHNLIIATESIGKKVLGNELSVATDSERRKHEIHREDDRATWIAWLQDNKKTYEYMLTEKYYKEKDLYQGKINSINKEIQRVKSLSLEQIIKDRDCFGRNEEQFK